VITRDAAEPCRRGARGAWRAREAGVYNCTVGGVEGPLMHISAVVASQPRGVPKHKLCHRLLPTNHVRVG
jgi:hypothetical protein